MLVRGSKVPSFTSMSEIVCHLFVATYHVDFTLRHERSRTSFDVSLSMAFTSESSRDWENLPSGKMKEVMIIYCCSYQLLVLHTLKS